MKTTEFFTKIAVLVIPILSIIGMLVPIPILLLDILMGLNLILTLLILFMVLYIKKPAILSIYPSVFLLATVFSMVLNIANTRLILIKGANFDGFLIGIIVNFLSGNIEILAACVFTFIIVVTIQVIIINKGAVRVAEVAARFTLDALPGKQMGIEAEYDSGKISIEECHTREENLQKEVNFYGAMDGCSKLLFGHIKLCIYITAVDILGGFVIGMFLHGETVLESAMIYIPLAIAGGLLFMFSALMLSVAAGMVVSRNDQVTLDADTSMSPDTDTVVAPDLLSLEIGHSLIPLVNDDQGSGLIKQIQLLKDSLKPGIIVPRIRIIDNLRLKLTEYCLKIKGVEAGRGELEMKGRTTAELCLVIANHIGEIIKEHDEELSKEDDEQCP